MEDQIRRNPIIVKVCYVKAAVRAKRKMRYVLTEARRCCRSVIATITDGAIAGQFGDPIGPYPPDDLLSSANGRQVRDVEAAIRADGDTGWPGEAGLRRRLAFVTRSLRQRGAIARDRGYDAVWSDPTDTSVAQVSNKEAAVLADSHAVLPRSTALIAGPLSPYCP